MKLELLVDCGWIIARWKLAIIGSLFSTVYQKCFPDTAFPDGLLTLENKSPR
jgi:hypothetical protein